MKRIKYMLVILISFFMFESVCLADSSNFQSLLNMEPDITENQVSVILGFSGEEVMIVKHKFAYDNSKLKLVEIKALDNFNLTVSKETKDGKYSIISVLADSDYSFDNSNYAVAVFELTDKFKTKKEADIFLYEFEGIGPGEVKYRNNGQIMTMKRDSVSYMSSVLNMITSSTRTEYWLRGHWYLFVIAAVVIIGLIILIIKMPTKRKMEKRDQAVADQLRSENYDANKNFKIDNSVLEEIDKQDKNVDISQAILVNENVKPFGNSESRFESPAASLGGVVNNANVQVQAPTNNAPISASFTNQDVKAPVIEEPQINAFNMTVEGQENLNENKTVDTELEQAGIIDQNENLTQIKTVDIGQAKNVDVSQNPTFDINASAGALNPINDPITDAIYKGDKVENFERPQHFKPMENVPVIPTKTNENNTIANQLEQAENNNSNNGIMNVLLIALVAATCLIMENVNAEKYDIDGLRKCLAYNNCSTKTYDYNFDGSVDILDLLSTKDTNNCNFEKLMNTDPGFKELHDGNSNIMSESELKNTTTTKAGKFTRKTTKKRTTTIKGTKTTKTTTTTKKSTTAKKSTTKKSTTAKSTTTKKSTTKKSTTVKTTTATPEYNITVNISTGESKTLTIKKGGYGVVDTTKPEGMGSATITCANGNVTATKNTSLTKFTFKSPKGDDTCTIKYEPKSSYKVTVKVQFSSTKSTTKSIKTTYNGSGSVTFSLSSTYEQESLTCDPKVNASYSNGTVSVSNVTVDSTCTLILNKVEG